MIFVFSISLHPGTVWRGNSLNPSSWGMELLMEESSLGACAVIYSSQLPSSYAAQTWRLSPPSQLARGERGRGARNDCKS